MPKEMTFVTTYRPGRRRQRRSHNNRSFNRSISFLSFLTIFLTVSFVSIIRIDNTYVSAADDIDDDNNDIDTDTDDVKICEKATISLIESNENLMNARKTHSDSMESSMENTETTTTTNATDWRFGFSENDVERYRTACLKDNDGNTIWTGEEEEGGVTAAELYFICDLPQMKITGKTVEFYGIGACLANTTECRTVTPMILTERLWKTVGLDCNETLTSPVKSEENNANENDEDNFSTTSNTTTTGGETDATKNKGDRTDNNENEDEIDVSSDESNNNDDEKKDEGEDDGGGETEEYPFMTVEDQTCMNATSKFVQGLPGLIAATKTYESTQIMSMDEEAGSSTLGYPKDAKDAIQSACELNNGYWSFIENRNFTCVVMGMETMSLNIYNFGSCLANIDECYSMDVSHTLESVWAEMNLACWEDDDNNESKSGDNGDKDTDNAGDNDEVDNDGDDNGDKDTANAGDNDGDNDGEDSSAEGEDSDTDNNNNNKDDGQNNKNSKWDDLGLSKSDEECMDDTKTMNDEYPDVEKAIKEFGDTMNVDMDDMKNMKLGFADEDVNKLKSVCSYVGGYFTLVTEDEFDCDMMSLKADLKVSNIANCIADTDECRNMNPLLLMENVFKSMGIKCTEKKEQNEEDEDKTNDSEKDNQNNNNNITKSDDEGDGSNDDDKFLIETLGLTESEITCIHNSSGFIDSSVVLSNATIKYQKSVIMTDPTKLGYPKKSFLEMENVCKDENGILSSIKSEDITCVINGRERCLNVYNFGNCLAKNDDCREMDPMALVKVFFLEVLKFSCRAKCEKHTDSGHSPSSSSHESSPTKTHHTPNLSSSSKDSTSGDNGSSSYITATVVLCVVVALGFFAYYQSRRSTGRERIPRRAYEMTDISDLRFQSLT